MRGSLKPSKVSRRVRINFAKANFILALFSNELQRANSFEPKKYKGIF